MNESQVLEVQASGQPSIQASPTWAAGWHAGLSAFATIFAGFGANSKGLIYKEYRGRLQATT